MGTYIDFEKKFNDGIRYREQNKYSDAIRCFEVTMNNPKYMSLSIKYLVKMYASIGNYKKARELLTIDASYNSNAFLEIGELNFNKSLEILYEKIVRKSYQYFSLYNIALANLNLGNIDLAIKILETLQLSNFVFASFLLVRCYILKGDYKKAFEILMQVDLSLLNRQQQLLYNKMNFYLSFCSGGKNNKGFMTFESDELLKEYMKRDRYYKGVIEKFDADADLDGIIQIAKKEIVSMNPKINPGNDQYMIRIGKPIGYLGTDVAEDIIVRTAIGTKDIEVITPANLSPLFDSEGFSHDEGIALKRMRGIKNDKE